jgi:hypothetical protein
MVSLKYFKLLYIIGRNSQREECHCITRYIVPILALYDLILSYSVYWLGCDRLEGLDIGKNLPVVLCVLPVMAYT